MVMSFCAVLFPRGVLDEILNLIESVSEDFPSYSCGLIYVEIYLIALILDHCFSIYFTQE